MRSLLVIITIAALASQLPAQAPSAPAEPDFLGPNGAQFTLGGRTYTIEVEQVLDGQGNWDHNKVEVTEGTNTILYDPANTDEPVNGRNDFFIQIWIGTPGDDTLIADETVGWVNHPAVMIGETADGMPGILGGADNDFLYGGGGDDHIDGGGGEGDDEICGGFLAGSDTLRGGTGSDRINGENGHDELYGDEGNNYLWGGLHYDTIYGGDGNDFLRGDGDDDYLYGQGDADRLVDISGVDHLNGGAGSDEINCLDGNVGPSVDQAIGGVAGVSDTFWADEYSITTQAPPGDDMPDHDVLLDDWVGADFADPDQHGPTHPADGTARPVSP